MNLSVYESFLKSLNHHTLSRSQLEALGDAMELEMGYRHQIDRKCNMTSPSCAIEGRWILSDGADHHCSNEYCNFAKDTDNTCQVYLDSYNPDQGYCDWCLDHLE